MRKDEAKSILLKTIPCPYQDNEKICHHLQEGGGDCESCYEEALDTILDLVEKQQNEIDEKSTIIMAGAEKVKQLEKEIEELKEQNNQLSNYLNDSYYISADEIREIIAEYRKQLQSADTERTAIMLSNFIMVLNDLLEEK